MTGSVKSNPNHDAKADAQALRTAMKGIGTNEKELIVVIANRTAAELEKVALEFKTLFGRDLIEDVKSETSGNFRECLVGRLMSRTRYDAYCLHNAISGAGTNESCLIEILASRSNDEIKAIKEEYKKLYKNELEHDLIGDTSGDFKRFLVSLVQGNREAESISNQSQAAEDAHALYKAGEGKLGTDESKFNQILASKSLAQLRLIAAEYKNISKKDLVGAIESETSGYLKEAFCAVVKVALSTPDYFAEKLYLSMKGLGTDDRTLIRVVTSRAEVDMIEIAASFQKKYGKSLSKFIAEDTSGDYKQYLLDLIS